MTWFKGFLGLVVMAQVKHPVPSRTRQLSTVALMVLRLKAWESKSLPNLVSLCLCISRYDVSKIAASWGGFFVFSVSKIANFACQAITRFLESRSIVLSGNFRT